MCARVGFAELSRSLSRSQQGFSLNVFKTDVEDLQKTHFASQNNEYFETPSVKHRSNKEDKHMGTTSFTHHISAKTFNKHVGNLMASKKHPTRPVGIAKQRAWRRVLDHVVVFVSIYDRSVTQELQHSIAVRATALLLPRLWIH